MEFQIIPIAYLLLVYYSSGLRGSPGERVASLDGGGSNPPCTVIIDMLF